MATTSTLRPLPAATLTFADLCRREPGLAQLAHEIRAFTRTPMGDDFCANARWYGAGRYRGIGYRPRLIDLVGWGARGTDPLVSTSAAYETTYRRLPALRLCGLVSGAGDRMTEKRWKATERRIAALLGG